MNLQKLTLSFALVCLVLSASSKIKYNNYFSEGGIRYKFELIGDASSTQLVERGICKTEAWGGNPNFLIDERKQGTYFFELYDVEKGTLIYSMGFNTLYAEWQTTELAKTKVRSYNQSIFFPHPKQSVKLCIYRRTWQGDFAVLHEAVIDPKDNHINTETPPDAKIKQLFSHSNPSKAVDIAVLAEGYTANQEEKFYADTERMFKYLFNHEPFKSNKDKFNVHAVFVISAEEATDEPEKSVYKNTAFNSHYNTFESPRYLTTPDMETVYDYASTVPFDQVYLLVNTPRYGGGGIYNYINVCTSDHELSEFVFAHEFGHGFAGLADEYYTSSTGYDEFYNLSIEPWEANITTQVDFSKKWAKLINKKTPVPTPRTEEYQSNIGVFEGGGYLDKGMYSPYQTCWMKEASANKFCPVCQAAIQQRIDELTK